jgi:hypothetical protein
MKREQVIAELKRDKALMLEKFGVVEIALFGSYARDEQNDDSDIDVMVQLKEPKLSMLIGALEFLEKKFNKRIDIVARHKNLSQRFWNVVGDDIIYV